MTCACGVLIQVDMIPIPNLKEDNKWAADYTKGIYTDYPCHHSIRSVCTVSRKMNWLMLMLIFTLV